MFELPHIDLAEVPVGLIELPSNLLDLSHLNKLRQPLMEALERFDRLDSSVDWSIQLEDIQADLEALPNNLAQLLPDQDVIALGGTHFLIMPVSDHLHAELDSQTREASLLTRTLHGFTDAWLGRPSTPDFSVDFIDHRAGGDVESLLDAEDFFDHSDFDRADHHIIGEFKDCGRFVGTIRVFDNKPVAVDIKRPMRARPICGPFTFQLGVVQGAPSESQLDPEAFAEMTNRLRKLGGLYVYMDGVRVQPYGRPDVDYLEIEERRTRGAAYYYFSYRRMFGAVSLNSHVNSALEEKAGREGFTQGRAFSEFQRLLMNLFEKLAATYFRSDSPQAYEYEKGRERLRSETSLRREREKRAAAGRREIRAQLANAVRFLDQMDFRRQIAAIIMVLEDSLAMVDRLQSASRRVRAARQALEGLLRPLQIDEPEGFALTEPMRHDLATVERGLETIEESYIRPALDSINRLANDVEDRLAAVGTDVRERQSFIELSITKARDDIQRSDGIARDALTTLDTAVVSQLRHLTDQFEAELKSIGLPSLGSSKGWIYELDIFERELDSLTERTAREVGQVANLVKTSELIFSESTPTPSALAAAADAEIIELRSRADDQLELVQLGMALSVIDHEFQTNVTSIRTDIRRLGSWAKLNPPLRSLYEDLRRDFDHLDSYLTLLTPMQRRLRRTKTKINGRDILRFLRDLFHDRLTDVGADIVAAQSFIAIEIVGFTSTFYPVFISLVDNSLYWFSQSNTDNPRVIELTAVEDSLVYRDSGPGIPRDIANRVFDFGFTTRPGGRGLGLAIARQVLNRAGWLISLRDCDDGAEFWLYPKRS